MTQDVSGKVNDVVGVVHQAQAVLAVALQAYIATSTDGRVKGWNPAAERTFGYTPAQACDRDIADLIIPARFRDAHRAGLARLAAGEPGRALGHQLGWPRLTPVPPPDCPSAWIRLAGDVDMGAEPALAEAADRLRRLTVCLLVIDLAAVTFAGATLTHFLDTVRDALPDAKLVLRHPSPLIRRILTLTGRDKFVVMTGDPVSSATSPAGDLERLLPARTT